MSTYGSVLGGRRRTVYGRGLVFFVVLTLAPVQTVKAVQPHAMGIGLYSPDLGLSPYDLFDQIDRLARYLSTQLQLPVTALAYKRSRDLARDMRNGKLQFAVISALQFVSSSPEKSSPETTRILASTHCGGASSSSWGLMAKKKASLSELRQTVLQVPEIADKVEAFIDHGLLATNIRVSEYFKVVRSPDLYSALEAVRLGAAQAVFAPIETEGLTPILSARVRVPCPLLVAVSPALEQALIERTKYAAIHFHGSGAISGFIAQDSDRILASTRDLLRPRRLPLLPVRPPITGGITPADLLEPYQVSLEMPPIVLKDVLITEKAQ